MAVSYKDYYAILGVPKDAAAKDVRAALMMNPELARSCASGKDLPPEIIARV